VIPSGGALGAEVRGLDLSQPLDGPTVEAVLHAWYTHQVLVFRNQTLNDAQLVAFSRHFGELMPDADRPGIDYDRSLDTVFPDIVDVVSNVLVDGKRIGALGAGEATWHTDTLPTPNAALILYGLEVPPSGGNTRFANMYKAYETLPEELRERVDGRMARHYLRAYDKPGSSYDPGRDKDRAPGPDFPIVRTHGITRRKSLFLSRQGSGYVHGLSIEASDELLRQLWEHMIRPEFVWEHTWQVGDLVVWDNRCTIHSRAAFDPNARRRMHRTTTKGEWPV
jgi:taurine dioxygenase